MMLSIFKPYRLIALCAIAITIHSCEGDPGPAGPQGPEGPQGPQGENGGPNAYTAIFDVYPADWAGDTNGYYANLPMPEITNDIYQNGAVLVYSLNNEGSANKSFNMLPYTYVNQNAFEYVDFEVFIGRVTISVKHVENGRNASVAPTYNYAFKVVIINGTPLSILKKQVNISNYEQLIAFINQKGI